MFVSLFKKNKFIILFLSLFFSCLSTISLKANPTFVDGTVVDNKDDDANTAAEQFTTGLSFNNDGTKMYIVGTESKDVHEFELNPGFDISTRTYAGDSERCELSGNAGGDRRIFDISFSSDGLKIFIARGSAGNEGGDDKDKILDMT